MYRLAICEDEMEMRAELRQMCDQVLTELGIEYEISVYNSAQALWTALNRGETRYDILCLDILMDGKTGMELAHELRAADDQTSILFISGTDDYLREGYTVRAIQYLSKPVDINELRAALLSDIRQNQAPKLVTLRRGSRTFAVPISGILYVESREHGVYIHMTDGERFFPLSLTETEKLLPGDQFCRCHNSFLVNMSCITEISRRWVTLKNDLTIPIGRRYYDHAQSLFVRYLNSN